MGLRESFILTPDDLKRSPLELFAYCEDALATKPHAKTPAARVWNRETQNTYHRKMERLQAYYFDGLGLSFNELEFEHFAQAVKAYARQAEAKGHAPLALSTRSNLQNILRSLTSFVHEKLPQYADPLWGSTWGYQSAALQPKGGHQTEEDRRKSREKEIDELVRLPRSLQIREESKFAQALRRRLLERDGTAIGGLLMLYLGLRPSECCGLTYGAIQLLPGQPIRALYIYQALDIQNRKKGQLKTKNAYRVLPIPAELDTLLQARQTYVQNQLRQADRIDWGRLPIVNHPDDYTQNCPRKRFSAALTNLLREVRTREESVTYAAHLLQVNGKIIREEDPTAYLLRRHYATILASVCLMDEEELQYLMGHEIRKTDVRRSDLLDTDWLMRMYEKLNRRHIFTKPQDGRLTPGMPLVREMTDLVVTVADTDLQASPVIAVDIWNECPADAVTLRAQPADPGANDMAEFACDYRPTALSDPPVVHFDAAYQHALSSALNRSVSRTKAREDDSAAPHAK